MTTVVHIFNGGPDKIRVQWGPETDTEIKARTLNVGSHFEQYVYKEQQLLITEVKDAQVP
jgi:hypothetical protein